MNPHATDPVSAETGLPVPIRPAASVLICRDSDAGPEVLLLERHAQSDVHAGAYVFPGGKLDAADQAPHVAAQLDQSPAALQARLCDPELDAATAAALHVAAAREVFEECALLLAAGADARSAAQAAGLLARGRDFGAVLAALGLRLDTGALWPWSRWITPERSLNSPGRRFDTRFFVTRAPAGQEARHDDREVVRSVWLRPREALEMYWDGRIAMVPPQLMSLAHLSRHASVDAILAEARARTRPCVIRPHVFEVEGLRAMAYPGDALHPERERAMPGPLRLVQRGWRLEPLGGLASFFAD